MSRYRGRSWGYASFSRDYDKRQKQKELEKKEKQRYLQGFPEEDIKEYLQSFSEEDMKEYLQKEKDANSVTMGISAVIVIILWILIEMYGG